jgi:hypothetical protein
MVSLASEIAHMVLAPALKKKILAEPTISIQRYFGCCQQAFEIGAVLGHAFRDNFVCFIQLFSLPGRQEQYAKQIRLSITERFSEIGNPETLFDLAMNYQESRTRKTWRGAGKSEDQIEDRMKVHELTEKYAFEQLHFEVIEGVGFGGTYPELLEKMWKDAYESPVDQHKVELLRRAGMSIGSRALDSFPLAKQQDYLLSGVRSFVKKHHPELIPQFALVDDVQF